MAKSLFKIIYTALMPLKIQHSLFSINHDRGLNVEEFIFILILPKIHYYNDTVKGSNFGPHGNFGFFLASSVASVDESCTKNEQNRICRSKVFPQLLFSSFFCRTRFNDSKPFWKRREKFPRGPKLEASAVRINSKKGITSANHSVHSYFKTILDDLDFESSNGAFKENAGILIGVYFHYFIDTPVTCHRSIYFLFFFLI
jgi:hypothetical protein